LAARSDAQEPLGAKGQWMVGGTLGASYQQDLQDSGSEADRLSLWFAPEALHFVARDLALGASLALGMDRYEYPNWDPLPLRADTELPGVTLEEDSIGGDILLAYRAGLGTSAFLLPRLALGVVHVERSVTPSTSGASDASGTIFAFDRYRFIPLRNLYILDSETRVEATLSLPLCFSPARAFFFGFGPYVRGEIALDGRLEPSGGNWRVAFGLASVLGSWF
jgi:hypothetical protein